MQPVFGWRMPVELRFGVGCSDELGAALDRRRAVVLAFEPATSLGLRSRWQAALGPRLLHWEPVADGLASVTRARELASRLWPLLDGAGTNEGDAADATVLVAVGGGTTLDLAKLLRCRPLEGGFQALVAALRGQAPWPPTKRSPLWLVPTTAGTGSEVTRWATVWDTEAPQATKCSLDEPWGYAERAFVDPALTLSCPEAVTRDTALDTLAHALESIWNHQANPVSTRLAIAAAQGVLTHLPPLLQQPADLTLRTALSLAALQAGLAFSQTRTALAHALSYDLTLQQGLPHGLACAVWLPTAWRLAAGRQAAADAALAEVFGVPAVEGVAHLQAWLMALGVDSSPAALARLGVADPQARVQAALGSTRGRNFIGAIE